MTIQCGVSPRLWKPKKMAICGASDEQVLLANFVTAIAKGNFWVCDNNGYWHEIGRKEQVITSAFTHWSSQLQINRNEISEFLAKFLVPVDDEIFLPTDETFIEIYSGATAVNTYHDMSLPIQECDIHNSLPILEMIRFSLCAQDDGMGLEEMLEDIGSNRESGFAWVMHWLANIRQNQGVCSTTALLIYGTETGMGKNTLANIMEKILGSNTCKKITPMDFSKGWTGSIKNKFFLHCDDEWKRRDYAMHWGLFKGWIGNDTTDINVRGQGGIRIINMSSFYFTSNEPDILPIEENDRRVTVIGTLPDQTRGRQLSTPIALAIKHGGCVGGGEGVPIDVCIAAFDAVLRSIDVDKTWISFPFENDARAEMQAVNISQVEEWLTFENEKSEPHLKYYSKREVWDLYTGWCKSQNVEPDSKPTGLPRRMLKFKKYVITRQVRRAGEPANQRERFYKFVNSDIVEAPVMDFFTEKERLEG